MTLKNLNDGFHIDGDYFYDKKLNINYYSKGGKGFPKTGKYLYGFIFENINKLSHIKNILEIGTGEIAFLGNTLANLFPHALVCSTEISKSAFLSAINNNFHENLFIEYTDLMSNNNVCYDLIVTNPPQMPTNIQSTYHDSGGKDGLDIIENIFRKIYKTNQGKSSSLIINIFDFLGVESTFGRKRSFLSLLEKYEGQILLSKKIIKKVRKGGETSKNIDYIMSIAPGYKFINIDNKLYHDLFLLHIKIG